MIPSSNIMLTSSQRDQLLESKEKWLRERGGGGSSGGGDVKNGEGVVPPKRPMLSGVQLQRLQEARNLFNKPASEGTPSSSTSLPPSPRPEENSMGMTEEEKRQRKRTTTRKHHSERKLSNARRNSLTRYTRSLSARLIQENEMAIHGTLPDRTTYPGGRKHKKRSRYGVPPTRSATNTVITQMGGEVVRKCVLSAEQRRRLEEARKKWLAVQESPLGGGESDTGEAEGETKVEEDPQTAKVVESDDVYNNGRSDEESTNKKDDDEAEQEHVDSEEGEGGSGVAVMMYTIMGGVTAAPPQGPSYVRRSLTNVELERLKEAKRKWAEQMQMTSSLPPLMQRNTSRRRSPRRIEELSYPRGAISQELPTRLNKPEERKVRIAHEGTEKEDEEPSEKKKEGKPKPRASSMKLNRGLSAVEFERLAEVRRKWLGLPVNGEERKEEEAKNEEPQPFTKPEERKKEEEATAHNIAVSEQSQQQRVQGGDQDGVDESAAIAENDKQKSEKELTEEEDNSKQHQEAEDVAEKKKREEEETESQQREEGHHLVDEIDLEVEQPVVAGVSVEAEEANQGKLGEFVVQQQPIQPEERRETIPSITVMLPTEQDKDIVPRKKQEEEGKKGDGEQIAMAETTQPRPQEPPQPLQPPQELPRPQERPQEQQPPPQQPQEQPPSLPQQPLSHIENPQPPQEQLPPPQPLQQPQQQSTPKSQEQQPLLPQPHAHTEQAPQPQPQPSPVAQPTLAQPEEQPQPRPQEQPPQPLQPPQELPRPQERPQEQLPPQPQQQLSQPRPAAQLEWREVATEEATTGIQSGRLTYRGRGEGGRRMEEEGMVMERRGGGGGKERTTMHGSTKKERVKKKKKVVIIQGGNTIVGQLLQLVVALIILVLLLWWVGPLFLHMRDGVPASPQGFCPSNSASSSGYCPSN